MADADEDLIYRITQAFWADSNRELLNSGHVKGRQIRLQTALDGLTVPLHPGARRYYAEVGLIEPPVPAAGDSPADADNAGDSTVATD